MPPAWVIIGNEEREWQDERFILVFSIKGKACSRALPGIHREGYFTRKRPELVGGGLILSTGGWGEVRRSEIRLKGDERILGDSGFSKKILMTGKERLERKYEYRSRGYDLDWRVQRVAEIFKMEIGEVLREGKYPLAVKTRSVLCFWAIRKLGMTSTTPNLCFWATRSAKGLCRKRIKKDIDEMTCERKYYLGGKIVMEMACACRAGVLLSMHAGPS